MRGVLLRQFRRGRGLSQEDLGIQADLTQRAVSGLEIGESQGRAETWERLAEALGVDANIFIGDQRR